MEYILVIDVGNTSATIALYNTETSDIVSPIPVRGGISSSREECREALSKLMAKAAEVNSIPKKAMLSSVVPACNNDWSELVRQTTAIELEIVRHDMRLPFTFGYDQPESTGADRIANVAAGVMLYGAPILIIDIGTAITYEVVSKGKSFFTGVISPGPEMIAHSLHDYTALLPYIKWWEIPPPKEPIDTEGAISYGINALFVGGLKETIIRLLPLIGNDAKVVMTGGFAPRFARELDLDVITDRELTLKGIGLLATISSEC